MAGSDPLHKQFLPVFLPAVVVGFSQLSYTFHEGDGSVAITLGKRGTSTLPITVEYYTEEDTASGI